LVAAIKEEEFAFISKFDFEERSNPKENICSMRQGCEWKSHKTFYTPFAALKIVILLPFCHEKTSVHSREYFSVLFFY
jgi:hypothetical protein